MTTPYLSSNRSVTANGIPFHYALDGDENKPLLALINMASHNLTCWEVVLESLLLNFRVLRFDIRGTGKSASGADNEFTFSHYADDLAAIMDALSLEKAFVVGVAYGARTAARFAVRHASRMTALGMFDVALIPPVEQGIQRALRHEALRLLEEAGEVPPAPMKYWRFYEHRDTALKAHTAHQHEADLSEKLGQLQVPALIACGRQDANLAEAQRIADHIPGCTLQVMEMTGHSSIFYRPALFSQLLREFAAKHSFI